MNVSIIVPALNEENYIESCLKSLKNQDFKGKYEIIVVDGNSKDNTVEIAKKYTKKVFKCKKGIARQRNYGAKLAKGNIFAFLDSDTIADKNWLSQLSKSFSKKDVVAVTGKLFPIEKTAPAKAYEAINHVQKNLIKINMPLFWGASCAFRKEAFEKLKGFNEKMKTSEDHDISLRMRKIGKVKFNSKMIAFTSYRRLETLDGWLEYISDAIIFPIKRSKEKCLKIIKNNGAREGI